MYCSNAVNKWIGRSSVSLCKRLTLNNARSISTRRGIFNDFYLWKKKSYSYHSHSGGSRNNNGQFFLWSAAVAATTTVTNVSDQTKEEFKLLQANDSLVPEKDSSSTTTTTEEGLYNKSVNEEKEQKSRIRQNNTVLWKLLYFIGDNIVDPLITCLRFTQLSMIFFPVMLFLPIILFGPRDPLKYNDRKGTLLWYKYLTWSMEVAGPSFIKLGQWAASRTDIFPLALCDELSKLHSNAKSHSLRKTKEIIENSFKMNFSDIFEEFHETPLGVGAMGQVYQAKLKPGLYIDQSHRHSSENDANSSSSGGLFYTEDGRPVSKLTSKVLQSFKKQGTPPAPSNWVVIKVLHPNVQRIVERDITIMKFFANAINWIPTMEWLSLPGEVEMFGHMMRLQLDLRIEADNLLMFRHNFSSASSSSSLRRNKDVAFPKPYIQYSSKEVLVEEFISGIPMTEFLKHTNGSKLDKEISDKGLDAFLKMLLLDNFIHSDLHPGNIYVRLYKDDHQIDQTNDEDVVELTNKIMELKGDQEKWQKKLDDLYEQGYRAQVCFIDTGLVTQLNDTNRRNFLDLFKAVAQFDGYHVGELMVERSRTPETAIDPELFALKVERLVYNIKQRTFALGSVKLGDLLFKVLSMVRQHHVRMEGDFITVVLSILLLEGIGRQLDPELDLFKSSIPILRQLGANERNEFLSDDTFSMAKVWLALEVRQFISASIQDIHNLVKYDGLCPNH